jgi:hypothetical protein
MQYDTILYNVQQLIGGLSNAKTLGMVAFGGRVRFSLHSSLILVIQLSHFQWWASYF